MAALEHFLASQLGEDAERSVVDIAPTDDRVDVRFVDDHHVALDGTPASLKTTTSGARTRNGANVSTRKSSTRGRAECGETQKKFEPAMATVRNVSAALWTQCITVRRACLLPEKPMHHAGADWGPLGRQELAVPHVTRRQPAPRA